MAIGSMSGEHFTWAASRLRPAITGGERYDLEVVEELRRKGLQINEFEIDKLTRKDHLTSSLGLRKHLLKTEDRLVLIDFGPHNQFLMATWWHHTRGGKVATVVHHLSHSLKSGNTAQSVDKVLSIIFLHLCNLVIVNSKDTQEAVINLGIPSRRVAIVYPALGVVPPAQVQTKQLPQPPYRLLYVGYFKRRKGFDLLLDALARLPREEYTVTAVGDETIDPGYAVEMHNRAQELGIRVDFKGRVETGELSRLYMSHDLLVHPARYEGFGMTLVEAQAHGLPVVAFAVGAMPEVLANGTGGILIPPFDTNSFARAITTILDSKEEWLRLRHVGLSRAKDFEGWAKPGRELYELLQGRRLL